MTHWAAEYPGLPYRSGADGPEAFDCWGLVRHVYQRHFGAWLDAISIGPGEPSTANVGAILRSARSSGMRPVAGEPADGDIVVMRSSIRLHCGVVVVLGARVMVLHAAHDIGVVCEPWASATAGMTAELWRSPA